MTHRTLLVATAEERFELGRALITRDRPGEEMRFIVGRIAFADGC
jgi:hypothetical protein